VDISVPALCGPDVRCSSRFRAKIDSVCERAGALHIMQHHHVATLSFAATVCFASVVQAASLNVSQGEVLLSRGAGYETIKGSVDLLIGDTVLGKPGSAAQLAFADGCTVPLTVGTVFRVGTTSPCKVHGAGLGASGATETPDNGGWATQTTEDQKPNVLPYVLGAAAIGGIVAVVASTGGSGSSSGGGASGGVPPPSGPPATSPP
jgi:hypothetical protein